MLLRRLASAITAGLPLICGSVLVLSLASPARAQGTMGMLPGPITTRELDGYAKRLSVSPQQRRALDAIHDQYKAEFRTLREGEIAEFLKKMREMDGGTMPKRKVVEDFLQQMDALTRKIASLDNRFFDQLQTTLTEQQLVMMPRVRLARQRGRMDNMQMIWMGGEKPIDVSAIAFAADLSDADRALADPLLAAYESRLTGEMEKLYQGTHKTILGMYEALEKLGITEDSIEDPEQMEKVGQAMQQVWMDMMANGRETLAGIADVNDRTQRSIAASMSPEGARLFRNRYYRQAFPEATFALFMHDYVFAPALKRDDLTPEQREAVATARDDMQRKLDGILDQTVAGILDWRKSINPFEYDQEQAEQYQKQQQELRGRADEARASANTSLEAALGKELLDKVGRLKSTMEEPQDDATLVLDDGQGAMAQTIESLEVPGEDQEDGNAEFAWGVDQFLPPAITEVDLAAMSDRLGLNDEQRSVLRDLHQRYNDSFQALNESDFGRLQQAAASLWQYDEQTQTSKAPTTEGINEVYRLRAAALEAIRKADDSFFNELELAVLTPEQVVRLPRVKLDRDRVTYNRGAHYWGGDSNEGSIDLARLLARRQGLIPDAQASAIDAELEKYEQSALSLFKDRYAHSLAAQKAQELWQADYTRDQAEGANNAVTLGLRYQEMMREPQTALAESTEAVGALNRATLDAVIALLPDDSGHSLRREYNRRAFPNVYGDTAAMDKPLDRARALPDLTPEQAQQLAELAARYHPAYTSLCEEMVKASEGSQRNPWIATVDETNADDWQKREEALARLRFDRNELNARAASQVQSILVEDQIKRIGGLPVVEDSNDFD